MVSGSTRTRSYRVSKRCPACAGCSWRPPSTSSRSSVPTRSVSWCAAPRADPADSSRFPCGQQRVFKPGQLGDAVALLDVAVLAQGALPCLGRELGDRGLVVLGDGSTSQGKPPGRRYSSDRTRRRTWARALVMRFRAGSSSAAGVLCTVESEAAAAAGRCGGPGSVRPRTSSSPYVRLPRPSRAAHPRGRAKSRTGHSRRSPSVSPTRPATWCCATSACPTRPFPSAATDIRRSHPVLTRRERAPVLAADTTSQSHPCRPEAPSSQLAVRPPRQGEYPRLASLRPLLTRYDGREVAEAASLVL